MLPFQHLPEVTKKSPDNHAIVLFGNSDKKFTKFLRKGFRHVAVLVPLQDGYVLINPTSRGMTVQEIKGVALADIYDLAGKEDVTLLTTPIIVHEDRVKIPLCLTCVNVVKRIIGIRSSCVWTPYQLYKHLGGNVKKNIT